jgi:hypothetical protein
MHISGRFFMPGGSAQVLYQALRKWNERLDQLVIVRGGLQRVQNVQRPASSIGAFPSSSDRSSSIWPWELFEGIGSLNVSISPKGASAIEWLKAKS